MEFIELGIKSPPGKDRHSVTCPNCSETSKHPKHPCLTVNNEVGNRWFKCHRCGWSGNLEVMEKYEKVRANSGMPTHMNVERKFSLEFTKYYRDRGFSTTTLTQAMIYETDKGLIGFPYYENYALVNVKFLNYKPGAKLKWWQIKKEYGTKIVFWGLETLSINKDPLREEDNIVGITEGEWDCLTYREAGLRNILSVPQGAPSLKAKNFKKEFNYLNDPYFREIAKHVDYFYISVDDDDAGYVLFEELTRRLGKWRCKIIKYPKGYKDINEVLRGADKLEALGVDKVRECYENATNLPIQGIIRPSDIKHDLIEYRKQGLQPGLSCGHPELDFLFTPKRGHISFWSGVPGMGKSVVLRWYLKELVKVNTEVKLAMFTPENRPTAREHVKLAELFVEKTYQEGQPDSMDDKEWADILNFIENRFIVVAPDNRNYESFDGTIKRTDVTKLQSICKYISHLVKTENIFGYVIDAYNKLDNDAPGYMSETKFIESQLEYLADFNTYHNIHGFIIAHPTKLAKDRNGNYIMPSVYDIKGSSAWYEKADIAVIIHRYKFAALTDGEAAEMEEENDDLKYKAKDITTTYLKVEKIRFEEIGTEGIIRLDFLKFNNFRINKKDKDYHITHKKINLGTITQEEDPDQLEIYTPIDDDCPF